MRLCHREKYSRRNQTKRTGILSRRNCSSRTILARPNRRAARLGADQPLDGRRGPAVTMVAAWTALYRRCSARHVAYRRGGNQSRDSGRGCNGEHNRPKTFEKQSRRKRASRRPATEKFPDSGHAGTSNRHSKQCHPAGPWQRKTVDPSVASEAASPLANSATDSCARNWGRVPSRAREDFRSSNCGQRGINPCSFLNHRRADGELASDLSRWHNQNAQKTQLEIQLPWFLGTKYIPESWMQFKCCKIIVLDRVGAHFGAAAACSCPRSFLSAVRSHRLVDCP